MAAWRDCVITLQRPDSAPDDDRKLIIDKIIQDKQLPGRIVRKVKKVQHIQLRAI